MIALRRNVLLDRVLEQDWEPAAGVLDALSHPVRLHHDLRALVAAGWLASTGRGSWGVPAPGIIRILVIILAANPY